MVSSIKQLKNIQRNCLIIIVGPIKENSINDHNLYVITHSGSFSDLRVLDLRGNFIRYPMTLKTNFHNFDLPCLEELYLNFFLQKDQSKIKKKNAINFNNDISFFFSDLIPQLTKLNVLWLKGMNYKLVVDDSPVALLHYKKLHLDNVEFLGNRANKLLENFVNLEELDLFN
jgi:signal peptidase I